MGRAARLRAVILKPSKFELSEHDAKLNRNAKLALPRRQRTASAAA